MLSGRAAGTSALTYRRGVVLVLAAGTAWSTMGLGIRLIEVANVWQILFYRSLAMAPFLLMIIALRSGGRPVKVIRRAGLAACIGGAGLVVAFAGGIYAIQSTTVANAMFLFAAAPFFTAILGLVLLGEAVRRGTWAAMTVALAGIAIMVANGVALGAVAGNFAALLSALGFAIFTVALRWRKLDDMLPTVFLAGIFAALVAAGMCLTTGEGFSIPVSDIAVAAALGVGQIGVGLTLYTIGSRAVPAAELALLSLTEVILGPFWVWLFLGETVSLLTLSGGGIVLAALAGNALSGLRRTPVPVM